MIGKLLFADDRKNGNRNVKNPDRGRGRQGPHPPQIPPPRGKGTALFFLIVGLIILIAYLNRGEFTRVREISYTDFIDLVEAGKVQSVTIEDREVEGVVVTKDGVPSRFKTVIPHDDPELLKILRKKGVRVWGREESGGTLTFLIIYLLPVLVLIGFMWLLSSRAGNVGSNAFNFGKSRARLHRDPKKVTFKDVAGVDEAKEELQEVIEFLKEPMKFVRLGARIPKGVLLVGPPGTGKTLLAKAVAGEAGVPFFSISGSEFVEMFVGVGAARVRDLFEQGKKNAPCIIFIDEIDAVGRSRGAGLGGSHDEREQTLNQLLVEMDGFDSSEGVIIMAATNRPDILDPALLRPGRFDRQIVVNVPDVRGRLGILKVHTRKIPLARDVDLEVIAKGTPGFTGADIANLVNEAALLAARRNKKRVGMKEFEDAKDKVLMGPERRSIVISDEEKMTTAYHEAGHAIVAHYLPFVDPIHKVTIIPRGRALGVTQLLPLDERRTYTREHLLERVAVILGGRAAEEFKFGDKFVSNGAADDLEKATKIVRSMVCEWGMSEVLGPVMYGQKEGPVFLGRDLVAHKTYSERVAEVVDSEIKRFISEALNKAKEIISTHKDKLEEMVQKLLEKETLTGKEIEEILGEKPKAPTMAELAVN